MGEDGVIADRPAERPTHETAERPDAAWELAQLERARRDPRAFAALYEAYVELVWRYTLARLGEPERAADATAQTFAQALAALPGFRPERRDGGTTFRAWLMTIARNVVIDQARRERPGATLALDDDAAAPWLAGAAVRSPEEDALAALERSRIAAALALLPATQRRIVELRAAGYSGAEIARALGMSLPAVKTANHRAYHRLRALLGEDPPGEDGTR